MDMIKRVKYEVSIQELKEKLGIEGWIESIDVIEGWRVEETMIVIKMDPVIEEMV